MNPSYPLNRCARLLATAAALGVPMNLSGGTANLFVDLELSLVVDVSGSVDDSEFNLQMEGYAVAFENPALHSAIAAGSLGQIAVNLIQFSSSAGESIGWTLIDGASASNAFATSIRNAPRLGGIGFLTDPSTGMNLATSSILGNIYDGTRLVIDVSGDGAGSATNDAAARDSAISSGIDTINGLPILSDDPNLDDYYNDNIIGGDNPFLVSADDFQDFEASVLEKLEAEISGEVPMSSEDSVRLLASGLRSSSVAAARASTRGVGGRLARLRAGVRSEPVTTSIPGPSYSAKGGLPKGGLAKSPIIETKYCPWEVYGSVFYSTQDVDQVISTVGTAAPFLAQPDTEIDTFGGWVGFDYDFNENWTAGFAISGSRSDVDMTFVGTTDIDTLALIPYVSYYRKSGGYDFWSDLLYVYGMNDYDTLRLPGGAVGNTEGDYHGIEFNVGVNLRHGQIVHGPFGQFRWLDGEVDGYTEVGPGAVFVPDQDYESVATQLGYQMSYHIATANGLVVPQVSAAWEHEFEADQGNFLGVPLGELDEDLAVIGAGVGYYRNCGWNVVLDYEGRFGSDTQAHYLGAKVGKEF